MKTNILYILLSMVALTATLTATSCKDDDPSATERTMKKLVAHEWTLTKATVDGTDRTSVYEGLVLRWNKKQTFSATNGGVIWPSTGTFSFTDKEGKSLLVSLTNNEETQVSIETLTNTELVISFHRNESTIGQGRLTSIKGEHIFEFAAGN